MEETLGELLRSALAGRDKIFQVDVDLGQVVHLQCFQGELPLNIILECEQATFQWLPYGCGLINGVWRRGVAAGH